MNPLYRVVSTVADWLDSTGDSGPEETFAFATRKAYEERNLVGLRMAYNDLIEITNAASPQERRDLDALLRARANTSLEALAGKLLRRIERIRERGKLTSEEQYYLVREHVEFIFDEPGRADEIQQLLAMMHEYEDRLAARAKRRSPPSDK